jgi:hypothetical protein
MATRYGTVDSSAELTLRECAPAVADADDTAVPPSRLAMIRGMKLLSVKAASAGWRDWWVEGP